MKTYNFTVEVEGIHANGNSLINSFINQANDEQNQLKITEEINKKSTKIYNKILCDFVEEINRELAVAYIKGFGTPSLYTAFSNKCHGSQAKISINGNCHTINIRPKNDRDFKDSKYTTYTGDYEIAFRNTIVKTVDDVLKMMETDIIEQIKKQ